MFQIGETPFYVALDHEFGKVVVCVRGTLSLQVGSHTQWYAITSYRESWQYIRYYYSLLFTWMTSRQVWIGCPFNFHLQCLRGNRLHFCREIALSVTILNPLLARKKSFLVFSIDYCKLNAGIRNVLLCWSELDAPWPVIAGCSYRLEGWARNITTSTTQRWLARA